MEDILPQGLTILAAPPKSGKSYFSLDLCLCVAHGLPFLGKETKESEVLYLALEDGDRRLQKRIREIWGDKHLNQNFERATEAPRTNSDLFEQLEEYMKSSPNTKLIIIDTLQKVRDNKINSNNVYGSDYAEIDKFKSFADTHNIGVLLVHHFRKMKDDGDVTT